MLEWRKICCPVDFSELSHAALQAAAELAQRFGASLTLLYVYELPPPTQDLLYSPPEVLEEVFHEYDRRLAEWKARAEHLSRGPVDAQRVVGSPAGEIIHFAKEGMFDLIVMGTHGRTGFRRAVFGSVAEKVSRQAPCPVLTIRPGATLEGHAGAGAAPA